MEKVELKHSPIAYTVITLVSKVSNPFSVSSRSAIIRRKRVDSDHSLVSEGLREAISSYLQMTESNDHSWDT